MEQSSVTCKNCSNVFTGNFCNACGEKLHLDHHKKPIHFLKEVFHFLTHFDGSFFTTLKTVFTKPGKYSLDYCNGIRKKYFKPVSYFMLLVVLYLLFPRFQGLNMKLESYMDSKYSFTWVSHPMVKKELKQKDINYKEFAKLYNNKSPSISKIALFILIPLASLVILVLFYSTRKYYFDHFVLSLELSGLFIALHFLLAPLLALIAEAIHKPWASFFLDENYLFEYFQLLIDLVFVSIAFKRFYNQKWWWTITKALIYLLIFGVFILYVYRLLVLVVTLMLA